jgi:hypothetical protein
VGKEEGEWGRRGRAYMGGKSKNKTKKGGVEREEKRGEDG